MAFRSAHVHSSHGQSVHSFLAAACTLLVPLALSCSSSGGSADDSQGPASFNQGNLPNQPGTTEVAPPAEGAAENPAAQPSSRAARPPDPEVRTQDFRKPILLSGRHHAMLIDATDVPAVPCA